MVEGRCGTWITANSRMSEPSVVLDLPLQAEPRAAASFPTPQSPVCRAPPRACCLPGAAAPPLALPAGFPASCRGLDLNVNLNLNLKQCMLTCYLRVVRHAHAAHVIVAGRRYLPRTPRAVAATTTTIQHVDGA